MKMIICFILGVIFGFVIFCEEKNKGKKDIDFKIKAIRKHYEDCKKRGGEKN